MGKRPRTESERGARDAARGCLNLYQGWEPPPGPPPPAVAAVDAAALSPPAFWRDYVAPRRPALLRGLPAGDEWRGVRRWTDEHLAAAAGDAEVRVEVRPRGGGGGFGRGRTVRMRFGDAVRRLAAGDASLYVTTQRAARGADGHPELLAPPLDAPALAADLPRRPALAGGLVPQSVNIWMGRTSSPGGGKNLCGAGASSGLHHDFHDNLYLLLRGRKRFRLWPPSDAAAGGMYTAGRPAVVHPNGRIAYAGRPEVRPDGAPAAEAAAWAARARAEAALAAAEAAAAAGAPGAARRAAAAGAALDAVLDAALDGGGDGLVDDFDAGEEEGDDEDDGDGGADDPDSFSAVDPSAPAAALAARFPGFPARAALEVEVRAGDTLYLPAGWFHEVTSFSPGGGGEEEDEEEGAEAGAAGAAAAKPNTSATHLALNYWFHPPDNLDPGPAGFAAPYTCGYWSAMWAAREARRAAAGAAPAAAAAGGGGEDADAAERRAAAAVWEAEGGDCAMRSRRPLSPRQRRQARRLFGVGRRAHLAAHMGGGSGAR